MILCLARGFLSVFAAEYFGQQHKAGPRVHPLSLGHSLYAPTINKPLTAILLTGIRVSKAIYFSFHATSQ